ncbi:SOS response-associated peptidase [Mesorhizobium sp.]|uniref:SOS response-associated peptidase n=1 Tax=Mesorhizobium sp. TaxID=1871066 RepID=UPI000FE3CCB9|nr:SOS response-associated peptidase [Mesorhizobium sp.]RWH71385.1 MAG: SOS response-associated peptidase [Mesorhizobium sp.]RWL30452.1 MAG: SOS response-associated peptidase [Mesorhizobium sp.]RWL32507.1 MAG: SOS response-associated peptidase [Mesorhizobium sp.]RWL39221.1 MAG: SOS response-associated peptidase [Mesorhizobium sp.]RWL52763.1 MAG: SOS response-associated peptidase [Mesorhizobium sp.]
MCGRFALTATPDRTAAFLGLAGLEEFPPRYNIAPTQPVLMALAGPQREPGSNLPDRQAILVRWGLIPAWVEDTEAFPLLINARSEGVLQKASFKTAMRHRRALVPASGFYEWQQSGWAKGQPYWIRPRRGGVIAFAGLIETYSEPGGSEMDTGAIITTEANTSISHIHDRMPVIIEERDFARWLDCRTQEPRHVLDLLKPAEPDFFEAIPVSDLVNKVANTGPEIQERVIVSPQAEKPRRQKPGADENQMSLF